MFMHYQSIDDSTRFFYPCIEQVHTYTMTLQKALLISEPATVYNKKSNSLTGLQMFPFL